MEAKLITVFSVVLDTYGGKKTIAYMADKLQATNLAKKETGEGSTGSVVPVEGYFINTGDKNLFVNIKDTHEIEYAPSYVVTARKAIDKLSAEELEAVKRSVQNGMI